MSQGHPEPIPLAIYTDGVRYTSALNSNTDSLLGVWVVNMVSQKRHLVCSLRENQFCSCGCKGWCTYWVIPRYLKWNLEALATGRRPQLRWNGDPVDDAHVLKQRIQEHGEMLGFRAEVVWIKGDWADANKTHGLPSVTSANNCC
eukprot:9479385-Pyramimonas_sp.AAC.1